MAARDGSWIETAPGLWAWKYVLDGFAVSDLWFQDADRLPPYMASLGRDYLLASRRLFDVAADGWAVEWIANGAGSLQMPDRGEFTARLDGDSIVMESAAGGMGQQRVVFSDFRGNSFRWSSAYSQDDGKTWITIMRMHARRVGR